MYISLFFRHSVIKKLHSLKDSNQELAKLIVEQVKYVMFCNVKNKCGKWFQVIKF